MHRESVKYSVYIYSVGYADTSFFKWYTLSSLKFLGAETFNCA